MPQSVHDIAVKRIEKATGIPSERILIHATHTHTGGPCEDGEGNEFFVPDLSYTAFVGKMAGDCGILACQRLQEATAKANKKKVQKY